MAKATPQGITTPLMKIATLSKDQLEAVTEDILIDVLAIERHLYLLQHNLCQIAHRPSSKHQVDDEFLDALSWLSGRAWASANDLAEKLNALMAWPEG